MKLMQIVSGSGFNGAVKYALELTCNLMERGHVVLPVCLPDSWFSQQCAKRNIEHLTSDLSRWPTTELKRVATVFRSRSLELLHTHNSRAHLFGVLLRRFYGLPALATAHQRHFHLHWPWNDYVIANSEATLKYQRRINFVPKTRSSRLYCPVDVGRIARVEPSEVKRMRASWGLKSEHLAVGCVGNIQERKSQLTLIRAIPSIISSIPEARFVIVGAPADNEPDYVEQCKQEAIKLGVEDCIHWVGFENRIPLVMNALELCVCVPTEESFGLTAAEALAAAKPVIATSVGGLPESVIHGHTGLLIRPNRPDELAASVNRLLLDSDERDRLGRNGYEHVVRTFGLQTHLENLESIYRRVAA